MFLLLVYILQFSEVVSQANSSNNAVFHNNTLHSDNLIKDWIPFDEIRYYISSYLAANFSEAQSICHGNGARLAIIKTDDIRQVLLEELRKQGKNYSNVYANHSLYIGFQVNDENEFVWSDDSNATSGNTYWDKGQPSSSKFGESFVVVGKPVAETFDSQFPWRIVGPDYKARFICEQTNDSSLFFSVNPTRIPPEDLELFGFAPVIGGTVIGFVVVIGIISSIYNHVRRRSNIVLTESMFHPSSNDRDWIDRLKIYLCPTRSEESGAARNAGEDFSNNVSAIFQNSHSGAHFQTPQVDPADAAKI